MPISLLQPHPDDVALSLGGVLRGKARRVSIYSVFDDTEFRDKRREEDRLAAKLMNAELISLGMRDGSGQEPELSPLDGLIMAPAAVSRHADHLAVRAAAVKAGCHAFWEDVAFWGIYGSSVDDRVLFTTRDRAFLNSLCVLALDITEGLEAKRQLLEVFSSQGPHAWRPIRYARTIGFELGHEGRAFERMFVRRDKLHEVAKQLDYTVRAVGEKLYGSKHFDTYVAESTVA